MANLAAAIHLAFAGEEAWQQFIDGPPGAG